MVNELMINYNIDILYNILSSIDFIKYICKKHYTEIIDLDNDKRNIFLKILLKDVRYVPQEILLFINAKSLNLNIIQKNIKKDDNKYIMTYTVNGVNGIEEENINKILQNIYYKLKIILKKVDENNTIIKIKNINNEISNNDNIILEGIIRLFNDYISNILTNIFIQSYFKKVNIFLHSINENVIVNNNHIIV